MLNVCTFLWLRSEPPNTGVARPSGPEIPRKSPKGLPRPSGLECQESLQGPYKEIKTSQNSAFGAFFNTFVTVLGVAGLENPVCGHCNRNLMGQDGQG